MDIDHLYLASYNYDVNISEDGVQYATTSFNPVDNEGKNSVKYHQNNILDMLMTLLKDSNNSINSLYKSIDNDTELPKSIADQIQESGSTKDEPYNFGTLHEQVIRKNDYITGKTGIGPFALNVTNQILTQLFGVKFKDTRFTKETGIHRLDHIIDEDGNYISSWLSAFINAHVDIVKDPWISKLNVNPFTYNMLNLMIRSGFGDVSLWFLAQPIIRDMASANEQAKTQYARDLDKTPSAFAATEAAIKAQLKKYLTEEEMSPDVIERYTRTSYKHDIDVRINTIKWIKSHKDVLAEIVKNPDIKTVDVDGVETDVKYVQKMVFYAWKTLEKYSIALGEFVQHTKIDTRKHGKSLIAIQLYLDAYNKLFRPVDGNLSLWDIDSLQNLAENSWIDIKTNLAISLPSMILGKQTFAANPQFIQAVVKLGNILSTTGGTLNTDALNFISRSMQTAIKSEYIIKYAKNVLGMSDKDIAGLFIGPDSINNWLTMLKTSIETKPEFSRLKNNHLLNQIYSLTQSTPTVVRGKLTEKPAFITVLDSVDDSRINSDLLIDGWTDLLNDPHPNVRLFARKLIVYSFLTSGEFKGWNKMFKYVPPAWIRGEIDTNIQSFSLFVENALNMSQIDYEKYFDDIVANNFMDYRLSKRIPQKNEDGTFNFVDVVTNKGTVIAKIGKGVTGSELKYVEKYITVKDDGYTGKGVAAYNLYKLAGFRSYGVDTYKPVYVKIKKRGFHERKTFDIYEYGWEFNYGENENESMSGFNFNDAFERVEELSEYALSTIDDDKVNRAIVNSFFDISEPVENEQNNDQQQDNEQEETINIWFSSNENADLSNFADRPFVDENGEHWDSVEQAFQAAKLDYSDRYYDRETGETKNGYYDVLEKFDGASGLESREIGRTIKGLNVEEWDKVSTSILKKYMKMSFEQNQDALERLLATGNAKFTHTQATDKYATLFPQLLIEIREELRSKNSENIEQNESNKLENDEQRFNTEEEDKKVIESSNTILSNEELSIWNKEGVGESPRILVASERTDPAFHVNQILDILDGKQSVPQWGVVDGKRAVVGNVSGKDFAGLYLITKHDGLPMEKLLKTRIPKLIHFSITGLGGTLYEPGVMKPNDLLDRIQEYINMGLDPNVITIRIDPIIPGVTTPKMIHNIVKRASEMGIKRIRFSIMDAYPNTVESLSKLGYDFERNYGTNSKTGKIQFTAKKEIIDKIVDYMLQLKDQYGITLGTCAEGLIREGISKEGCLSVDAVNRMLGTSIEDKGTENNTQRVLCSCFGGKIDALQYNASCASHCVYCYAKHENDKALQYYNEDGTLKNNVYTTTSITNSMNTDSNKPNSYSGDIHPDENTIFVFGSNPEGRHGAGSAKIAVTQFGAIYGQGEGLQGNSYAIPTKDLRITINKGYRSISSDLIIENIKKMYEVARQYPDKQFKVAYRNDLLERSLNGYTGGEMIAMFLEAGEIPENVLFSEEWINNWDVVKEAREAKNNCK